MSKWINYIKRIYFEVINSIAFYPTLLAIGFLILSFLSISIEFTSFVMDIKERISPALVHNSENARLVLGTIVGSIISLMVFSFSMVMVVLNRATATLSPRVLPGLISSRFHQVVLGFYIGTIIFSLILIVNIDSPDIESSVPAFGILLSMIFAIICLGLFVYFIHSISQKIQVDNILNTIYSETSKSITAKDYKEEEEEKIEFPEARDWYTYSADYSGYLKKIDTKRLKSFCEEYELKILLKISLGTYVIKNYPFVNCNKELDQAQQERLISCFLMYTEEHVTDHYQFGFNQISEIAIKALSPGINDPGTAIRAIDLLADLFIQLMHIREQRIIKTDNNKTCIFLNPLSFQEVLYKTLVPIRKYGSQDILVLLRLLTSLQQMLYADDQKKLFYPEIYALIENIIECSKGEYNNSLDKNAINNVIEKINKKFDDSESIEKL